MQRSAEESPAEASAERRSGPTTNSRPLTTWEWSTFMAIHLSTSLLLRCLGLRGLYAFSRFFGTIEYMINYKRRRRFARALEGILGEMPPAAKRRKLTREFFCQSRCDRIFYMIFDCLTGDQARSLIKMENRDKFDKACAKGRGVYVALSHQGAQHAAGMLIALMGYKVAGVRDKNEGSLRRYVQQRFANSHPELSKMRILFSDAFPRDIYRLFEQGYVLGSAMDVTHVRHETQKTELVSVFGEQREFLSGPLRIALRCKAPVFQAFIVPEKAFVYRVVFLDGLVDQGEALNPEEVVSAAMHRYAANVEKYIRQSPALVSRV